MKENIEWQRRWDMAEEVRHTYGYLPDINTNIKHNNQLKPEMIR